MLANFSPDSDVYLYVGLRDALYPKLWNERRDFLDVVTDFQFYFKNKLKIIEIDELKRMGTDSSVTYINMDAYKASIGFCSIDSLMM